MLMWENDGKPLDYRFLDKRRMESYAHPKCRRDLKSCFGVSREDVEMWLMYVTHSCLCRKFRIAQNCRICMHPNYVPWLFPWLKQTILGDDVIRWFLSAWCGCRYIYILLMYVYIYTYMHISSSYVSLYVQVYIYTVRMLLPQLALDSGGILDRRSSVGWACRGFGAILSAYLGGYAMVVAARTVRARI